MTQNLTTTAVSPICPNCHSDLTEQDQNFRCNSCNRIVGKRREKFLDFMLDVDLDEEFEEFYEGEGTEADDEGGPRINAQKFKIPNILEVLPSPQNYQRYLDMGCGGGWIMEALTPEIEPDLSVGIDISETRLYEATSRNSDSTFYRAPVENVPIADNNFDLITCLDVIEHIPEPAELLKEAHRLSKHLIIKFPIEDTVFDRFQKEYWWPFKKKLKEWITGDKIPESFEAHLHRFNFQNARRLLKRHGFEIINENIILNPWTEGDSFMYPPAYNITDDSALGDRLDFHFKRNLLKTTRLGTYILLNPWYYRIFNSGIYFFCKRK